MPSLLLKEVEGSGGAGLSIGDYVQTERTELEDGRVLLPVKGQLITSTYPLLEAELPDRRTLTSYSTVAKPFNISIYKHGFCSKADGTKSWAADDTNGQVFEIDNTLQTSTLIYTPAVVSHSLTAQCSNDGTKLYFLDVDDSVSQDIFTLHYSHDSGSTWSTVVIYDAVDSINYGAARIECSEDGVTVKIMLSATSTSSFERNFIRVFSSSDSGVTFTTTAEQNLGTSVYTSKDFCISKDLTTLGLRLATGARWLSTDGGSTFTEETKELLGPSVLVATGSLTAISSDGSTIISCPITSNLKTINISTDGMSTWTTLELEISDDYLNAIQCLLSDPTDPNVFYILQSAGNTATAISVYDDLYKLDVSTGTLEYISNIPKPIINSIGTEPVLHQVSKAYVNGSDILLSFADYYKRGYSFNLTLSKGKYLPILDSRYKIVTDAP